PRFQGVHLAVAAVGDTAVLRTVEAQLGEWKASRGGECSLLEKPVEPETPGGAHLLVFRGDRIGDLVDAGALAVLPESIVQPPPAAEGGTDESKDGSSAGGADAPTSA